MGGTIAARFAQPDATQTPSPIPTGPVNVDAPVNSAGALVAGVPVEAVSPQGYISGPQFQGAPTPAGTTPSPSASSIAARFAQPESSAPGSIASRFASPSPAPGTSPNGGQAPVSPTVGQRLGKMFSGPGTIAAQVHSEFSPSANAIAGWENPEIASMNLYHLVTTPIVQLSNAMTGEEKAAHPVIASTSDFVSGLSSPGNIALIAGTAGLGAGLEEGGAVTDGLIKLGMSAPRAAATVRTIKFTANASLLTQFGATLGESIPAVEQDYRDVENATNAHERQLAKQKLEYDATQGTLSALATLPVLRGLTRNVEEFRAASPAGRAMANSEYANPLHDYQAEVQTGNAQAQQIADEALKVAPKPIQRIGISNYVQYGGDTTKLHDLELHAASSGAPDADELAAGYKAAQELTPAQVEFAQKIRTTHDNLRSGLQAIGKLPESDKLDPNYIHHAALMDEMNPSTGEIAPRGMQSNDFLRSRVFKQFHEGEDAGYRYQKDAGALTKDYVQRANNLLAQSHLADKLDAARSVDGAPLVATGGAVVDGKYLIPNTPVDRIVTKAELASLSPEQLADLQRRGRIYSSSDAAGNRQLKWNLGDYTDVGLHATRFVGNNADGQPIYARVPAYVSPDVAAHLGAALDQSQPQGIVGAALKVSSAVKSAMLSLSPFHYATELIRGLEAGQLPGSSILHLSAGDVDYFNLSGAQRSALRDGVTVESTRPGFSDALSEGLAAGENSLINKIPGIGRINQIIQHNLFGPQGFIAGLKFKTYDAFKSAIVNAHPELDEETAGRIAAHQVNNKFGGLNYTLMGRSLNTQNALRAILLAPDFLESTGRSVLDLASPYGGHLVRRLVAFNIAQYVAARAVNYLVSGQLHPEAGMGVVSQDGKKDYSVRTTLADYLHLLTAPVNFAENRVNPVVRTGFETTTGIGPYGRKLSPGQRVEEAIKQVVPIPAQSIFPSEGVATPNRLDQVLRSFGIQNKSVLSPAEQTALDELSQRTEDEPAPTGEELTRLQTEYRLEDNLRQAYESNDHKKIADATNAIFNAGPDVFPTTKKAENAVKAATASRLESAVNRLALNDAFDVWAKASVSEQQTIAPLLERKIERWQEKTRGTLTPGERSAMDQRITSFEKQRSSSDESSQNPFPVSKETDTTSHDSAMNEVNRLGLPTPKIQNHIMVHGQRVELLPAQSKKLYADQKADITTKLGTLLSSVAYRQMSDADKKQEVARLLRPGNKFSSGATIGQILFEKIKGRAA